jgi:hypothetical protein
MSQGDGGVATASSADILSKPESIASRSSACAANIRARSMCDTFSPTPPTRHRAIDVASNEPDHRLLRDHQQLDQP